MTSPAVIFVPLAMNQTLFFAKIATALMQKNYRCYFIPFHERSHDYLQQKGFTSYNVFTEYRQNPVSFATANQVLSALLRDNALPQNTSLFAHEACAFELTDHESLTIKFYHYINGLKKIYAEITKNPHSRIIQVQELGGFAGVLTSFYMAQNFKIDNFFLEPAFFRGRVFILKNSIYALPISQLNSNTPAELSKYLSDTLSAKKIVIPEKDKKHYWGLYKKIINFYNIKRFVQKLTDKYLLGKKEEFSHIGMYTMRHLKMFIRKSYLAIRYYQSDLPKENFIYFPLHVPMDVALTLRSPHCLDQYALLDQIARSIPIDYKLVIKEHPAMVGVLDSGRVTSLMQKNPNLIILDAKINNFEIMEKAKAIVTVNSKSGAEGLLLGKKIIVLGDAFYSDCPLVNRVRDLSTLTQKIEDTLNAPVPTDEKIRQYFSQVWQQSYPGEIYNLDDRNINQFAENIINQF